MTTAELERIVDSVMLAAMRLRIGYWQCYERSRADDTEAWRGECGWVLRRLGDE